MRRLRFWFFMITVFACTCFLGAQRTSSVPAPKLSQDAMDRDLLEVTIPKLQEFYRSGKYTVTDVVQWTLDRIERYNPTYMAVQTVDREGALAVAAREDSEAKAGARGLRPPLWGIPILIKANTSVQGLITTDGWRGFMIRGHELVAPKDATVVAKLRAAGAVIIGQTNMPDFAASDTNRSSAFGRTGNAYDVRFSPGGSSGGAVTAVTANMTLLGTGTDTANSIRMPSATSSVVGVLPTQGLVSMAGIVPLDWLLDDTGPIARTVADAAIALDVMAGEDPSDSRTAGASAKAQPRSYTQYLKTGALQGKRFGVPAFVLAGAGIPFQGVPPSLVPGQLAVDRADAEMPLRPETREAFMKALAGMRDAGATVVFDESFLPDDFAAMLSRIFTLPYMREGMEKFLSEYGPEQYHSTDEYARVAGSPLPSFILGGVRRRNWPPVIQSQIENDKNAAENFFEPRRKALEAYAAALDRLHLDGLVYPAIQMPPPDETKPEDGHISTGPHSLTSWVNMIGVPAVVVPGGFYPSGLPFGLELAARPWKDGDLLGWAYAYEQATKHRKPPTLVERR